MLIIGRNHRKNVKQTKQLLGLIIVIICLTIRIIFGEDVLNIQNDKNNVEKNITVSTNQTKTDFNIDNIPEYTGGEIYIEINNNMPYFLVEGNTLKYENGKFVR